MMQMAYARGIKRPILMMQMVYARGIKRPILMMQMAHARDIKRDADGVCKRYKERCRWRMQENIQNG